jgi:gas vesicle protein
MRRAIDREALLKRMGLEERTPAGDFLTGLGLFSIGVLVGAGLGLMFAPKRGEEMRATLEERWRNRSRREPNYQQDIGAETSVPPPTGH